MEKNNHFAPVESCFISEEAANYSAWWQTHSPQSQGESITCGKQALQQHGDTLPRRNGHAVAPGGTSPGAAGRREAPRCHSEPQALLRLSFTAVRENTKGTKKNPKQLINTTTKISSPESKLQYIGYSFLLKQTPSQYDFIGHANYF